MSFISSIITAIVLAASAYASYFSAQSIPKLQQYEQKAEKAAEWSATANKQLWDTRYTVGAGFIFSIFSLYNATSFLIFTSKDLVFRNTFWAVLLAGGAYGVGRYMRMFWGSKAKVPLVDDYNRAIEDTAQVMKAFDALMVAWLVLAPFKLFKL